MNIKDDEKHSREQEAVLIHEQRKSQPTGTKKYTVFGQSSPHSATMADDSDCHVATIAECIDPAAGVQPVFSKIVAQLEMLELLVPTEGHEPSIAAT